MSLLDETHQRLARIPSVTVRRDELLSEHTRFGIGGPADLFVETVDAGALQEAAAAVRATPLRWAIIGGGTNLVVSDHGYRGIVLRYSGNRMRRRGNRVYVESGANLQALVDYSIAESLSGIHTLTGVPGWVGAAVYGNAGAYGRSMHQSIVSVDFYDGARVRTFANSECEFQYRESIFKRHKNWIILSAVLELTPGDGAALKKEANDIRAIRDAKYPPTMKCAGSIFKNLLFRNLPKSAQDVVPANLVRDGKVPSAYFLEQVGVKGYRNGGIHIADYHANLIFNAGGGTARELREVIDICKARVEEKFGFELEEEVQYLGFEEHLPGLSHLAATPELLRHAINGLTDQELEWKPAQDRWSIAEVLAHLAHCEEHCFHKRLRQYAQESEPVFQAYDPEGYDAAGEYKGRAVSHSLGRLTELRRDSLKLACLLPPDIGAKRARHSQMGTITLAEMMNEWAFHDLGHIRQTLELIRAGKYYPQMGPFAPYYKVNP